MPTVVEIIVAATETEISDQAGAPVCAEWARLFDQYLESIAQILELQFDLMVGQASQPYDPQRVAALERRAEANKLHAKNTLMRHIRRHGC